MRRPHPVLRRPARITAALLAMAALAACGGEQPTARTEATAPTTRFTENGVTVTLSVSDWHPPKATLTAVFTPEEGFHLYSTDLPATGIEGVGRPTAVNVTGVLAAEGRLTAAAPVQSISLPGVDAPVPVYPDGPVTTTLPVRATGNGNATVLVGYASCSSREGCTIPVADRPVQLRITDDGPAFDTP
ncbi:protein-disulfide reductase DsbD family protein [Streptomyces venezuelae]|uniref:protein-disulfide reductase DsbD family protein n=1 Tax=Streptomyces venezuelae TaxID=54571 RepID=UPI00123B280F|nr:protein-disulfide reductase DsbD family protein [Streptomyces venezuelae]